MLHHIRKHKHGIKQTFMAYLLLIAVGFGMFYFFKTNTTTKAFQGDNLEKTSIKYQALFPDTEGTDKNEKVFSKESSKTQKSSYQAQTNGLPSYLVKMVIDGDTFVIEDDKRIRLAGIKAPDKDEELGIESTDFLRKLISGKEVYIDLDKLNPKDSLGRFRAVVYVDKRNVNIEMIRSGLAHIFEVEPSMIGFDSWSAFEKEARELQKGLWNKNRSKEEQKSSSEYKIESIEPKESTPVADTKTTAGKEKPTESKLPQV